MVINRIKGLIIVLAFGFQTIFTVVLEGAVKTFYRQCLVVLERLLTSRMNVWQL